MEIYILFVCTIIGLLLVVVVINQNAISKKKDRVGEQFSIITEQVLKLKDIDVSTSLSHQLLCSVSKDIKRLCENHRRTSLLVEKMYENLISIENPAQEDEKLSKFSQDNKVLKGRKKFGKVLDVLLLNVKLKNTELSTRAINALENVGIEKLGELVQLKFHDLATIHHLGKKTIIEIEEYLNSLKLTLGMDVGKYLEEENQESKE